MRGGMEQGNPDSRTCRHCERAKVSVKGVLMCPVDDAPMVDGRTIAPTWAGREDR